MIWFAWRQFRTQSLIAGSLLLALAIAFLVTEPHLTYFYQHSILGCTSRDDCNSVQGSFLSAYPFLQNLLTESPLLPVLIGIFWGAPVVAREFDTGTYRLAWTQSASRTQWLAAKVLVGGLATLVTEGLFTLMGTWWSSTIDRVRDQPFSLFDARDIVPIGYALFAFALGVALGAVVRRVIPAMVLTIAGFAGVRGLFNLYVRPHLDTIGHATFPLNSPASINQGDWILSSVVKNAAGKVFPGLSHGVDFQPDGNGSVTLVGVGRCPNTIPGTLGRGHHGPGTAVQKALNECVSSFHLRSITSYQAVSHYWTIQWLEFGSYLVFTGLLVAFGLWWVRRL